VLEIKKQIRTHYTGVNAFAHLETTNMLCTVSNDCHVNLFNMQEDCAPYFSLRGHQKPVYTICSANITEHVADDLMSIDDK
jgi:hypothetical protein